MPDSMTFNPFFNAGVRLPCFSADILKKCALIALRVIAEEGRDGNGFQAGFGDEWKMCCPKCESEGKAWSECVFHRISQREHVQ